MSLRVILVPSYKRQIHAETAIPFQSHDAVNILRVGDNSERNSVELSCGCGDQGMYVCIRVGHNIQPLHRDLQ
jgi:hypothetical protein